MADRSVVVRLRAEVAGFKSAMDEAAASARKVKDATSEAGSQASTSMGRMAQSADQHREAWDKAGVAVLGFGAAALAGVAVAVKAYADFDAKMSQVKSLSHASAGDMDTLTQAALSAGTSIGFSAGEVADAEIELVKAGASVKDMMGGALVGALTLAAAGQIEVGKATEIATIAMTQFKLSGKDIPHVSDLLAAGADKALGGVQELGDGLRQGGLVASQFGLTIDDTVGTLSAFANAGLLGSDAGTSMKTMFLALASPSKQAQAALDQYNITAYDAQGKFKGVADLAGQLHDKLGPLSDAQRNAALSTIFGTDAMRSAAVLMNEGRDGISKWISDVNDQGFAAEQAAGKMDNMNGDLKKLGASFQTGLIEMGQSADGFLRPVIQNVTGVVNAFNALPQPVKGAGLAAAAALGGVATLAGGFLLLAPRVLDTINGFKTLATDMPGVASKLGAVGKAAGVAAAGFALLQVAAGVGNAMMPATSSVEEATQALIGLKKNSGSVDDLFKKFSGSGAAAGGINGIGDALSRINHMDLNASVNKFFSDVAGIPDQLKPARDEIGKIDQSLSSLTSSGSMQAASDGFKKIAADAQKQGINLETTAKSFPQYLDALRQLADQQKIHLSDQELLDYAMGKVPASMQAATDSVSTFKNAAGETVSVTKENQKALDDMGLGAAGMSSSVEGAVTSMDKLVQSLENAGLMQLSANDAARAFQAAIDGVTDSIAKNGKTLDITTPKGRENAAAFDAIAKSGLDSADAMAKNGATMPEVQGQLRTTYDSLITAAGQFGITGDAAKDMAGKVLGIPKEANVDSWLHDHASAAIDALTSKAKNADGTTVNLYTVEHIQQVRDSGDVATANAESTANQYAQGNMYRADGGPVPEYLAFGGVPKMRPRGTDTIPAMLTPGEFVVNRKATATNRALLTAINDGTYQPGKASVYSAPVQQAVAYQGSGVGSFTGSLYLDSGEFLGTVSGVASQVAQSEIQKVDRMAGGMRR